MLERYSYDAWGVRRSASDWSSPGTAVNEHRGYTGQEHLDDIGIIHMNGRLHAPGDIWGQRVIFGVDIWGQCKNSGLS